MKEGNWRFSFVYLPLMTYPSKMWSQTNHKQVEFPWRSSCIICNETLSSSSSTNIQPWPWPWPSNLPFDIKDGDAFSPCASSWPACALLLSSQGSFFSSFIVVTHLDLELDPAWFCQIPMREVSVSSLRQVREGEDALLGFRSFAWRMWDKLLSLADDEKEEEEEAKELPLYLSLYLGSPCSWRAWDTGKLVLALLPHIITAAWSYALAASSALWNVPSHTLFFLRRMRENLSQIECLFGEKKRT